MVYFPEYTFHKILPIPGPPMLVGSHPHEECSKGSPSPYHDRIDTRMSMLLQGSVVEFVVTSISILLGLLIRGIGLFQFVLSLLVRVLLAVLKCTYVHIVVDSVHFLLHKVLSVPFEYDPTFLGVELGI